ncbi:MAG: hypothetical protein LC620_07900 [Halobacteriales archaeon]|nr:hypothetical protein [Halobacteriales archaeon]
MAPTTNTERQPNERHLPGRCTACGQGFRALNPAWTQCRACYWADRTGQSPVDPRAAKRPAGRELPDGSHRTAAPAVPRFARSRDKAKGRAATLRLMALATRDPLAKRALRARAYDLEHEPPTVVNAASSFFLNLRGEVA